MKRGDILLTFIIIFFSSCSLVEDVFCFPEANLRDEGGLFISLMEVDNCVYELRLGHFENHSLYQLVFDSDCVWANLSGNDFELLFCFSDTVGACRNVSLFFEEINEGSRNFCNAKMSVLVEKKEVKGGEHFLVLRFSGVKFLKEYPALDVVAVFSDRRGVIGTYFSVGGEECKVIEERGDILKSLIDYSGCSFYKIE